MRARVFERDGGQCAYCRAPLDDAWQADHVIPRSRGGRHVAGNRVAACPGCNQRKGDSIPRAHRHLPLLLRALATQREPPRGYRSALAKRHWHQWPPTRRARALGVYVAQQAVA